MAPASSAPSRGADEYFPVHGGSTGIVHETLYEDDEASSGSEADAARDGARKASVRFGQLDAADAAAAESDGAGAGPRSLSGRHLSESARSHAADSGGDASGSASPSSSAKRLPAAGAGSRVGPRPVPKDSASLRHISFRSRLSGIPSGSGSSSAAAAEVEPAAATFRRKESRGKMAPDSDEEDSLDDEDDEDEDGSQRNGVGRESWQRDLYGIHKERADRKRNSKAAAVEEQRTRGALSGSSSSEASDGDGEIEEDDGEASDDHRHEGSSSRQLEAPRPDRPGFSNSLAAQAHERRTRSVRRAPWHPRGPLADGENSPLFPPLAGGLTTPGPQWPHGVNTPMGTPPDAVSPEIEPRARLEWQTMLESVLASEVLRSETKRITSADAAIATREEQMYARWLDIRASLRGRGHLRGAVEAEEKRLNEGWAVMVRDLIRDIHECRPEQDLPPREPKTESTTPEEPRSDVSEGEDDDGSAAAAVAAAAAATSDADNLLAEVGALLARVDSAEEQFPSSRKMQEVCPEWNDEALRHKLDALYSWHNVTSALRLQLRILQQWTGSETLSIEGDTRPGAIEGGDDGPQTPALEQPERPRWGAEIDATGTFVERILREDSLQGTFEKRTLSALNALVLKAKRVILKYHEAFRRMALPSFEPLLVQLINFPTRLVLGALRLRLDYAGKLREPSLLIVDSLTDDLRAALALACRVRLQYSATMVPDPDAGWDLPPCIGDGYDATLREALRFFFKLLNFKLKGAVFFKETEILEPEWRFLSTAAEVIQGGDLIVARSVTKIVNKLFARIVTYFERELSAPSTRRGARFGDAPVENNGFGPQSTRPGVIGVGGVEGVAGRGPATAGGLTRGKVRMTLEEKVKWIHAVFENVRIRSRKLLGFARDIRNRLDNAAEYDLGSLRSPPEPGNGENGGNSVDQASSMGSRAGGGAASNANSQTGAGMDLNGFLQTLINAGYFLVLTGSFEPEGIYLIAEPSLHDKPELIQELFCRCIRRGSAAADAESSAMAAEANLAASVLAGGDAATTVAGEEEAASDVQDAGVAGASNVETEAPRYLLLLSPRDAFMWTGRIMTLKMPRIGVDLKDRRLRLIADGPKGRLAACKAHLYSVFHAAAAASAAAHAPVEEPTSAPPTGRKGAKGAALAAAAAADALAAQVEDPAASFPLEIVNENMAHMFAVQTELRKVNKGVYMLSDTVIRAVPSIRRNLRGRHVVTSPPTEERPKHEAGVRVSKASTNCDELIQNCFGMAAEQGFRALPFIESARLQGQMTLALARLSIDWVAFICDDCVPGDRRTFKWAVAALENAMQVTRSENIFQLSEDDFGLMRTKVASCMALLISQFDILGARSSVAKAQEEQERLDREKAERDRARNLETAISNAQQQSPGLVAGAQAAANLETDRKALAAKMVHDMGGAGAPPMLNRQDSGMQATEERWVQKVMEWDAARQSIEAEQRLIGRVLDDAKPEDRGLQFLASSSSRIQIRWQQGRFIGGGTFGTVYLAVNLDSGGLMAVKEIRFQDISSTPSLYKQIKDEMTVMEMLSHPNIVEYYGIEVHRDKVYIFEEYCQGGSLAQLLEHGRIEDEAVTQVYTLQMLDGLVYLHSKGVVHRDIKPDNILLDHLGVVKFVDFGAAKILAKNSRTVQRSRRPGVVGPGGVGADGKPGVPGVPGAMGSLQGTPMYMSPEVIKGDNRGRRGAMDVWSLGCVVLEFATGRRPWSQLDNEWAIMFHIGMAQQHPPLPEPGQLSELGIDFIRQCLIIDPYDRPSAAEMRDHPWIQNLVDELNAANEEEAAADAAVAPHDYSSHGSDSAAGVAALAATPGTRSINGFNFNRAALGSLQRSETGYSSSTWSRQSAGGMPGSEATSVSGGAGMPSSGALSQYASYAGSEATDIDRGTFDEDPHIHVPYRDEHEGSSAFADRAYDRERAERHALGAPDGELEELDAVSPDTERLY